MMRLLLVRHGLTEWNHQSRYQGMSDVPLSEEGLRQASRLTPRLAGEGIQVAYASVLKRAWRTAEIATRGLDLALVPEPRLQEMSFGILEGLTFEEARSRHSELIDRWLADYNQPPPGGESLEVFTRRVGSVLQSLVEKHEGQTVLLVAHGGPLCELVRLLLGLPVEMRWSFLMDNASVSEIRLEDGLPFIRSWNETCHLRA